MRQFLLFVGIIVLLILIVHGSLTVASEWRVRTIHRYGAIVDVKIESLDCPAKLMTFKFKEHEYKKKIDARTCVVFNVGQTIKLRHSEVEPDTFLFVNERNPNLFLLGGLEIAVGLVALIANWPSSSKRNRKRTVSVV